MMLFFALFAMAICVVAMGWLIPNIIAGYDVSVTRKLSFVGIWTRQLICCGLWALVMLPFIGSLRRVIEIISSGVGG